MKGWSAAAPALLCAAVFLCGALPALDHPGLNHDEAFQAAEAVLFLNPTGASPQSVSGIGGQGWVLGKYPWMTLDYVGALKTYLVAAAFALFGVRVVVLRALTVACGAACVVFTVLLAQGLYGTFWALMLGSWLATDPALILMARHDSGPFILTLALKMAGLFCFAGAPQASLRRFFLGGVFFGLALWDKAHFVWWLGGLGLASVWLGRPALPRSSLVKAAVAGLCAGAAPWLLYNVRYPMRTFVSHQRLSVSGSARSWEGLPSLFARRWELVPQLLSGQGFFSAISGERAPDLPARLPLLLLLGLLLAAAFAAAWRSGRWRLRQAAYWTTAALLVFFAACLTPLEVGLHHMPMLYPLPHLAAVSLLWAGGSAWRPRGGHVAGITILALALAAQNVLRMRDFRSAVARTRGSVQWFEGLADVAAFCSQRGSVVATMDLMYGTPLVVYSAGKVSPVEEYPGMMQEAGYQEALLHSPAFFGQGGGILVDYVGPNASPDPGILPRRFVQDMLSRRPPALALERQILYSDGSPWTSIYAVAEGHGR